ncbi:hypothetical protein K0U07_03820 [bacterium]|nr:hypothetical protein [bacterium]
MKYFTFLFLFLVGCGSKTTYTSQVQYHDNGVAKPKVAIVKVIDSSKHSLDWDLSSEFTELFLEQLFTNAKFYLTDDFHMIETSRLVNLELSPYSADVSWIKEMNSSSEFVIFTEVLEHTITSPESTSYNPIKNLKTLHLSMRVRVLDIRFDTPKIVLQEVINKNYTIPFHFGSYDENKGTLAKNTFSISPLGIAHKSILSEITKEVEEYITIARSTNYE